MATVLLILVVVLVLAALVFGVVSLLSGDDPGLGAVEPDGRAVALPNNRSLTETDLKSVRFDVGWRGYRMAQVDRVLRRTAYDVGYKDEMIAVLEAEVQALREGRAEDAELLRKARESAANPSPVVGNEPTDRVIDLDAVPAESVLANDTVAALDDTVAGVTDFETDSFRPGPAGARVGADASDSSDDVLVEPVDSELVDSTSTGSGLSDAEIAAEEARLEAARQEAATPGRIAGRGPHSTKYAKRAARSTAKATNGTGRPTDAPRAEAPAADDVPGESGGSATLVDTPAVAASETAPEAAVDVTPEATDPPADRSARA